MDRLRGVIDQMRGTVVVERGRILDDLVERVTGPALALAAPSAALAVGGTVADVDAIAAGIARLGDALVALFGVGHKRRLGGTLRGLRGRFGTLADRRRLHLGDEGRLQIGRPDRHKPSPWELGGLWFPGILLLYVRIALTVAEIGRQAAQLGSEMDHGLGVDLRNAGL